MAFLIYLFLSCIFKQVDNTLVTFRQVNWMLTSIPNNIPANAEKVDLENNLISTIDDSRIQHLDVIIEIILSKNLFETFPNLCSIGDTLEILKLDHNRLLTNFPQIHLQCLIKLQELFIKYHRVKALPDVSPLGQTLTTLQMNEGFLKQASSHILLALIKMEKLYLGDNKLTSFPDIRGMRNTLVTLSLKGNDIDDFPANSFNTSTPLRRVSMLKTNLDSFPNLCALESGPDVLELLRSPIVEIDYDNMYCLKNLKFMSIGHPSITDLQNLTFEQSKDTLEELVISLCSITKLPNLGELSRLVKLDISNNQYLTSLPPNLFNGWLSLEEINLSGCLMLQHLADLAYVSDTLLIIEAAQMSLKFPSIKDFAQLKNLEKFDMQQAKLSLFPALCSLDPANLEINLSESDIDICTCQHLWLKKANQHYSATISLSSDAQCDGLNWKDAGLDQLYSVCESSLQKDMAVLSIYVQATGRNITCNFLSQEIDFEVTVFQCAKRCLHHLGCYSFSFRAAHDKRGDCMIYAPYPVGEQPPVNFDPTEWIFYEFNYNLN